MPKLGQRSDLDLPVGPLRDLTEATRECLGILSDAKLSLRAIAEKCYKSKSAVSDLATGKRKRPDAVLLRAIHELAAAHASQSSRRLPPISDIEQLLEQVSNESRQAPACPRCGRLRKDHDHPRTANKPAASLAVPTDLPVPPAPGDRQVSWDGMAQVRELLDLNRFTDLAGIIRYVGRHGAPSETAEAIAACHHDADLTDTAIAIAHHAARRPDEEVLHVVSALLESEYVDAAKMLMSLRMER